LALLFLEKYVFQNNMKKQLTVFIISFFFLIIGGYFFFYSTDDNLSQEDARNFGIKEINRIDKIFLADKKGTQVTLTKENDVWRVNGNYVAREIRIQTLLKTAKKIKVKQRVTKAQEVRILKNLATNNIKAEFFSKNNLVKSYFIGSADGSTTGTYMLLIDEESGENFTTPFLTHLIGFEGYLTPRYEPNPNTWRDLKIFFFPKNAIQSVKLEYPSAPENNFEIKLEKSDYALFQKKQRVISNPIAIKNYLLNFKSIAAENILTSSVKDAVLNKIKTQNIWFSLSVTNFLGKTTTVKGYKKKMPFGSTNSIGLPMAFDPDRFYGICFNNELTTLQYFVFDPLLIKKSDLE
tara:strand:+ start:120 stop:1169 length:1050 start_codon:yes stop_codon:yes gene_type:complete